MELRDPIAELAAYLRTHAEENVSLEQMSALTGYSAFHLQRRFKAALGVSPKQFHSQCRKELLKEQLRRAGNVTDALFAAGYGSTSRVYENTAETLGMTPREYRQGAAGLAISFVTLQSDLAWILIAATDRGLCALELAEDRESLRARLAAEFPAATLTETAVPTAGPLADWEHALHQYLAGQAIPQHLPLDIRATAFQASVWRFLRSIPSGETRSYAEVAAAVGRPTAVRAVARACAANPVALAIPCHRVIRGDGQPGGYRWGLSRKLALLEGERRAAGY